MRRFLRTGLLLLLCALFIKSEAQTGSTPVVTTSTITGNIIGCVGSPGESPNIGKFTVAGTSLSGDITVTPPTGFDLSLTAIGGYSTSLTLKQIGGTVINRDIYIRSSAADPVGPISGNIQLTTPGATADLVPVTGEVNALPTVNTIQNVPYSNGAITTPIVFTGSADSFDWINDQPAIGLPASGAGNIPSFSAINNGGAPLVATITVTPKSNTTGCPGTPITFTITVSSLFSSINPSLVSGTISACVGSASASPNIQQFTVSGSSLTGDITATAPPGFEISLVQGSGFGNALIIPQAAGTVSNATVYVRSAASDPSGSISGNVVLSSPGAASQNVAVSGTVNALPKVNAVTSQTKNNGAATDVINFTGIGGDIYNWTNDVPGIGLPASGTGNIASFNAIDVNGDTPVTATLTVTPVNRVTGCTGTAVTFTITVNPASPPVITSSGTMTGLSTIYGTFSSSESFTVSASNLTEGILVTVPQGFELSTDNQTFSSTITVGQAGNITNGPVYIRLAGNIPVGNYFGNIVLSTSGASDVNVSIPISVVSRAILTVTAPNVTRIYGVPNPVFIPQYQGFVNGDNESSLTTLPELTSIATTTSPEGKYAIYVTGGSSHNYIINPVDGTLTIIASESEIIVPNAFTPNGDGINDLWTIQKLSDFPQCLVSIYTRYGNLVYQSRGYAKPWDGTSNGSQVPTGIYYYVINPNQSGFGLLSGYVAVLR
ncbi:MAG: T9SS type B sorting domain-containing protein [Mucilaginibacter sp.]